MRRNFFISLMLIVLLLVTLAMPAAGHGAEANPISVDEIDSIVLTLAPTFGLLDELIDTVAILRPGQLSIAVRYIRQHSGDILDETLFAAQREDYNTLLLLLNSVDFLSMPEYIETHVLDGHFTSITINWRDGGSKSVGGIEAEDFGTEDFIALCDSIGQIIENSYAYPNWYKVDPLEGEDKEGIPLFDFCEAENIAARIADDPPIRASVGLYTIAGGTPFITENENTVRRVAGALTEMIVYDADGMGHTDDYLIYTLEWADKTTFSVTFQGGMLLGERMELYPAYGFDSLFLALQPLAMR